VSSSARVVVLCPRIQGSRCDSAQPFHSGDETKS
jgi:hypothetical protein